MSFGNFVSIKKSNEKLRSAPLLELSVFEHRFLEAPDDAEARLTAEEAEA